MTNGEWHFWIKIFEPLNIGDRYCDCLYEARKGDKPMESGESTLPLRCGIRRTVEPSNRPKYAATGRPFSNPNKLGCFCNEDTNCPKCSATGHFLSSPKGLLLDSNTCLLYPAIICRLALISCLRERGILFGGRHN